MNLDHRKLMEKSFGAYSIGMHEGFDYSPFHKRLVSLLSDLFNDKINRLIISMPPRHGKSLLCSELFPAWFLGHYPNKDVMFATYGQELASGFGRKVRANLLNNLHQFVFPKSKVIEDSRAAHRLNMKEGGGYFAVGLDGSLTGRGADLLIMDDLIKNREEADSQVSRDKVWDFFRGVAYTRLEKGGKIILIMTRWHEDDLVGRIIENNSEDWTVLNLPAINDEGEALWPEKYSIEDLEKIKSSIGPYEFEALYQGRPTPREDALFNLKNIKYYSRKPKFDFVIQAVDTSVKANSNSDFNVISTLGVVNEKVYLLDLFREKLSYPDLKAAIKVNYDKHKPELVLIEDKANGSPLLDDLGGYSGIPLQGINVTDSKYARALPLSAAIASGKVYLPKKPKWMNDVLIEMKSFPNGKNDDIVDSISLGFNQIQRIKEKLKVREIEVILI